MFHRQPWTDLLQGRVGVIGVGNVALSDDGFGVRLAEALLRIPDPATADRLIRDKISQGDWKSHLGGSPSLFVNAATWGLMITRKLVSTHSDDVLQRAALARRAEQHLHLGLSVQRQRRPLLASHSHHSTSSVLVS